MDDPIFDLEQEIFKVWAIVDDLDLAIYKLADKEEEEAVDLLIAMKSLYSAKFENLFETFEKVCENYHKARKMEASLNVWSGKETL